MPWSEVVIIVAALLPLVGNLLALALRRAGYPVAADWVVRMTPLAIIAASSKTREEAIRKVVTEVAKLEVPEAFPAQVAAATLVEAGPPSSAAKIPAEVVSAKETP